MKKRTRYSFYGFFWFFFCAHLAGQGRRWQVATRGGGGGGPTLPHQTSSTTAPELLFRHAGCAGCVSTSPAMRNSGRHTHTHKKSAKKKQQRQTNQKKCLFVSSRHRSAIFLFFSFLLFFVCFWSFGGSRNETEMGRNRRRSAECGWCFFFLCYRRFIFL